MASAGIVLLGVTSFSVCYQLSAHVGPPSSEAIAPVVQAETPRPVPSAFVPPTSVQPLPTYAPLPASPPVVPLPNAEPQATALAPTPPKRLLKSGAKSHAATAPKKATAKRATAKRATAKKASAKKATTSTKKAAPAPKKTSTPAPKPAPKPKPKPKPVAKPANAAPSFRHLVSLATGLCLDSNENGDVYGLGCNTGTYQDWSAVQVGSSTGKTYQLRDQHTGRCLSHSDSRDVFTDFCNSSDAHQKWQWTGTNAASVWVQVTNGECLDGNENGDIYLIPSNGGGYQHWRQQTISS